MADVTDDVERVTGRAATPFARFATDHVPAWGPTPSRAMAAAVVA
jgi:hypothetical protein